MINSSKIKNSIFSLLAVLPIGFGLAQADDAALLKAGKEKFNATCATCHGEDGKSQSPMGMALKARNLVSDPYKQGKTLEGIMGTIQNGVPGTGMVGFAMFSAEDRKALATYILSLSASTPATAPASSPAAKPEFKSDAALAAKGEAAFKANACNTCHGDDGKSQSPMGIALKARNFTADPFKQGKTEAGIMHTIKAGIPGTGMAGFANVSDDDRKAIAHWILTIAGGPDASAPATPESTAPSAPATPSAPQNKVSISYAMAQMTKKARVAFDTKFMDNSAGAKLYAENCASCHGANGEGGLAVSMVSAAPYYRVKTEALLGHDGYWMKDVSTLTDLIVKGLPGGFMPGNGTLTKDDLAALHKFMQDCVSKAR